MTEWKFKMLGIAKVHEQYHKDKNIKNLKKNYVREVLSFAKRHPQFATELEDIAGYFEAAEDVEETDDALEILYDWADANSVWINPEGWS